jgi:UDP-N-acetylglucosamine 1-carboxyvinyltransferase
LDRIAIIGGARLEGEIPISGAKNSAIKLMAASLLTEEPLRLTNMPRLADTRFLGKLLQRLGTEVSESDGPDGPETVLRTREIVSAIAPYDLVRQMRASFNVLGPLLARTGQAKVSLPGGCTIGARPVDLHLQALEALGARIDLHEGYVYAQAPRGLRGGRIDFAINSVGATEHAMLAAVLAEGESVIRETIFENRFMHAPELSRLGADISVSGGEARVRGVESLEGAQVMATDLRASVSLVIAGLAAHGETMVNRVYHLDRGFERLEEKLGACGAQIRRIKGGDDED